MELAAKIDSYGKGAWIALLILTFVVFWPLGLALLAYMFWTGRIGCPTGRSAGRWHNQRTGGPFRRRSAGSGNIAFDEYREETLRRLEDEQGEFESFLERLRKAKDRAEFDQFMRERSRQPNDTGDAGDDEQGEAGDPNAPQPA